MLATPDAWICWEPDVESADPTFPARHSGCPVGAVHCATSDRTRPPSESRGRKSRPVVASIGDHREVRVPLCLRSLPLPRS
jgi:hypothetical protein